MSSPDSDQSPPSSSLEFERADFSRPVQPQCQICQATISAAYYEANGKMICAECRTKVESWSDVELSGLRFLRAAVFGLAAAVLGAAIYFGVAILTGYEFGLIAILVGYLVGSAVKRGSGAAGGLVYQGLAVFLTYCSVVVTYVPLSSLSWKNPAIIARAFFAPFEQGTSNIFGLIIIGIALYEAWRLNHLASIKVTGPYQIGEQHRGARP